MDVFNEIKIFLPWPPSINQYLSNIGNRRFLSKKSRQYQNDAITLIAQQRGYNPPININVAVDIQYVQPDNRVRDVDNFHKCVIDSLTKAQIWNDDSQMKSIKMDFVISDKKNAGAYLRINPHEPRVLNW